VIQVFHRFVREQFRVFLINLFKQVIFGLGPRGEWTHDAVDQLHAFTDLQIAAHADEPAELFDVKETVPVAAVLLPAALDLDM
jgi:hypothetical protein